MASTADILTLLASIDSKGRSLDQDGDAGRRELLAAARALVYKLETPIETLLRICWAEVCSFQLTMSDGFVRTSG